ncbi:hypothetical protein FQN60_007086 [Etheostoma spectabile]|uniref:Uncharacterized protein n=1 Tax=Etheostoma spectabile TaxID=54343 RepID=A0A5J5CFF8_9PERO|nr:hypothetical protein FQN60_007086 [Etheostoma spectabile]
MVWLLQGAQYDVLEQKLAAWASCQKEAFTASMPQKSPVTIWPKTEYHPHREAWGWLNNVLGVCELQRHRESCEAR